MKLIFIYGPPGTGKLTIAQEIEKMTKMKIFHNHMTFDYAAAFFEPFSNEFNILRSELTLSTLKHAAKSTLEGLIFTMCYTEDDLPQIREIQKVCGEHNVEIFYYSIRCNLDENLKRIKDESRKRFKKLTDEKIFIDLLGKYNLFDIIPETDTLVIENTEISALDTAKVIVKNIH